MFKLWLAIGEGALMSILWVAFLAFSGRLPNQPLRRYYQLFAMGFILLAVIIGGLTLNLLGLRDIHQRRTFLMIVMGTFAVPFFIAAVIAGSRKTPTSGKGGSS